MILADVVVPITEYSADVLEVLKESDSASFGGIVRLGTIGGEADWAGSLVLVATAGRPACRQSVHRQISVGPGGWKAW